MSYLKRTAITGVVVLTAGFLACRENPADVAPTGNLALELTVAEGVSLGSVDEVRVRLSQPGAADINFTLSSTGANQYEGTRTNLAPGTYTVTIRGITFGEVEFFGETTANVQVGVDATVNINLTSFEPAIDPIPNTTSVNFTATWPAVIGAESYEVEASSDPTFQTFFAPDLVTDAGSTISADFTAPGIGSYYVSVRAQRSSIETGRTGFQTAGVVNAVVPAGTSVSSTIATANEVRLLGVTASSGVGMSVLAFRTGASTVDLDVSIGPVDDVFDRVGGNHDMGALGDSRFEWLLAYESPPTSTSAPRQSRDASPAIVTFEQSHDKPVANTTPEAVVARLQSLITTAPAAPSGTADAQSTSAERTIQVFGANGTTGAFDVFFNTCLAFETGLGTVASGTLADTDCFTFNPVSGNITRGQFWVSDGIGGEMVDLQLTSATFDPVLFLFGPDGSLVWYNDDFNGLSSRIVTTLPSDGTYIAFVASYGDLAIGGYDITMDLFVGTNVDAATSTISAAPSVIPADGASTSTVTVQLKDGAGAAITTGGDVVTLETTLGSLSGVTDNANGSYTATLTAGTEAGTATITGTVNGMAINSSAIVTLANPNSTADPATSTIAAAPSSIPADGVSTTTISVQLKDGSGTNLTAGGDAVTLATTAGGTLSAVTDNNNGTYTATFTAGTTPGTVTITGTLNGTAITDDATVTLSAPLLDRGNGLIYDPDLDITYYDFSFGPTNWSAASTWANNLVFGGFADWRLAKMKDDPANFALSCSFKSYFDPGATADRGYNKASSELGHLFYEELNGVGLFPDDVACDNQNANPGLVNGTGPFQNLQADGYWMSTPHFAGSHHWNFRLDNGGQGTADNGALVYAIAVRDGDVTAGAVDPATSVITANPSSIPADGSSTFSRTPVLLPFSGPLRTGSAAPAQRLRTPKV